MAKRAGADARGCGSAATRVLRLEPRAVAVAVDDGEGEPHDAEACRRRA